MPDPIVWLVLLLPVAAASGWWTRARAERIVPRERARAASGADIDDSVWLSGRPQRPGPSMPGLLSADVADDESVDNQLALGRLYRRQGDIQSALAVHGALAETATLSPRMREHARYELAHDYLAGGVLDRAEDLFAALAHDGSHVERALNALLSIHERAREWRSAAAVADRLAALRETSMARVIAQYHCEQALEHAGLGDMSQAWLALREGTRATPGCARASLIEGDWLAADGRFREALACYRRVVDQDARFAAEIVAPAARCFDALADAAGKQHFFSWLGHMAPRPVVHVALAEALAEAGRDDAAIAHLSEQLQRQASWRVFHAMLSLSAAGGRSRLTGPLDKLRVSLTHLIEHAPTHGCDHCGFTSRHLHWQCPSCRRWETMTPLADIGPRLTSETGAAPRTPAA